MIQCAGSRDENHLPYCSRVCCNQAVKNALNLKQKYPETRVDILYRDMRCYGLGELNYRRARMEGINFIRYDPETNPPEIKNEDGPCPFWLESMTGSNKVSQQNLSVT